MKTPVLIVMLALCVHCRGNAQNFQNLDFEDAVVVPHNHGIVFLDWNDAAPGWNHSDGADTSIVYYGGARLGTTQYYLLHDSTSPVYTPGTHLSGEFSLALASGIFGGFSLDTTWVNAFISQTGLIPEDARSVKLLAGGPGSFEVQIDGMPVRMHSLGGGSYGGDITDYAGQLAEIRILNTADTPHTPTVVDNIEFSMQVIPEPGVAALLIPGVLLLLSRRARRFP